MKGFPGHRWSANVAFVRDLCGSTAHLVRVGEDAFLAGMPQFLTTEVLDGDVLRHSRVTVGAGAYVGFAATLGPRAVVEPRAAVADMALVGAGVTVATATSVVGLPRVSERHLAFRRSGDGTKTPFWGEPVAPTRYHAILSTLLLASLSGEVAAGVLIVAGLDAAQSAAARVTDSKTAATILAASVAGPALRLAVGALVALACVVQKWALLGALRPFDAPNPTLWDARSAGSAVWLAQFRANLNVDAWLQPLASLRRCRR